MNYKLDTMAGDSFSEEPEVQAEITKRDKAREEEQQRYRDEMEKKDNEAREVVETLIQGIEIEISNEELWNGMKDKNKDPYGKCVMDYAEAWAKLMQVEIAKGKTVVEVAGPAEKLLGYFGITGFMYGAAINTLANCWKHGEELRVYHNNKYGHKGKGTVNPAVITVGEKSNEKAEV